MGERREHPRLKPVISPRSLPWLRRIHDGMVRGRYLEAADATARQAPSDILDGWAMPDDLTDLVRRRILMTIPIPRCERIPSGSPVTWEFTGYGLDLMRRWSTPPGAPDAR